MWVKDAVKGTYCYRARGLYSSSCWCHTASVQMSFWDREKLKVPHRHFKMLHTLSTVVLYRVFPAMTSCHSFSVFSHTSCQTTSPSWSHFCRILSLSHVSFFGAHAHHQHFCSVPSARGCLEHLPNIWSLAGS